MIRLRQGGDWLILINPGIAFAPVAASEPPGGVRAIEGIRAPSGGEPRALGEGTRDRVDLSITARNALGEPLSKAEQEQLDALKKRDAEVRRHEEAHQRVGGQYASAPSYEYQKGPDGQNYAVGGEVQIDASPVAGDPDATIDKMEVVKRAALAPAEPSGQDRAVAAQADATAQQARQEKREMEREAAEAAARSDAPPAGAANGAAAYAAKALSPTAESQAGPGRDAGALMSVIA